ncbi:hypothetical protein [Caballeronia telluris]|uniref:hypothetical protein n=1 Tax=Caballeronia telluris TaxID=326475 RepID=UPI000F736D80|nr:hypothetical protein [Caballeronia telluris]
MSGGQKLFFVILLSSASGWPNIRLLVSKRGRQGNGRFQKSANLEAKAEKDVDGGKKILHNLVSLLLMQRRKTEGVAAVV